MLKQVIIIRSDLKMSKGKIAVQACHASLGAVERADKDKIAAWKQRGQKKAVVKVKTKKELGALKQQADNMNFPNFLVADAGLTELKPGTVTALSIGPDEEEKIDKISGELPLL